MNKVITSKDYNGAVCTLVHSDTKAPAHEGDTVTSSKGVSDTLSGGTAPHKPASTGKVYTGSGFMYFPSVYGLEWEAPKERLPSDFDLLYDVKTMSDVEAIANYEGHCSDATPEQLFELFDKLKLPIPKCLAPWQKKAEIEIKCKQTVLESLSYLHTDLHMLRDGTWEPDNDSVDCSIEMVERLLVELKKLEVLPEEAVLKDMCAE